MNPDAFAPISSRATAAAVLVLCTAASPSLAAPDWDMAGVKLGMTEAEVKAALVAYDPKGKISASNSSYNYSDGLNSHRTPAFLSSMEIRVVRLAQWTPIKVWFSGPDGPARVIAIARNEGNLPNPVTRGQFLQSLQAKYGPPTAQWSNGMPYWEANGKPSCVRTRSGGQVNFGEFPQVTSGHKTLDQAVGLLEAQQQQPGGFYTLPADLTSCGTFMYYTAVDPVSLYTGGMYDVGAIVATQRARQAWVDKLRSEAVRKREGQGQAPRL
ncbi:MAG: hypothetical protein ACT6S0_22595 [Roseateles sp.]|uniref:hypothetical protein n=2 Tax=Roseateles sp. TaxID=1971397 RepID=UPI004035302E